MSEKFTAIYVESELFGSHMMHFTRMLRLEKSEQETVLDMLAREQIESKVVYLFNGWPTLQGETEDNLVAGFKS